MRSAGANIVSKAHLVRGFLQRNLRQCLSVKAKVYFAFVRPTVEHVSVIWSPYIKLETKLP